MKNLSPQRAKDVTQKRNNEVAMAFMEYLKDSPDEGVTDCHKLKMFPDEYGDTDYIISGRDGNTVAFIETKVRDVTYKQYKTAMLPYRKHTFAFTSTVENGIPAYYVCAFADGVYFLGLWTKPTRIAYTEGRYDRGGRDRKTMYAFYDVKLFKKLPDVDKK